MLHVTNGDSSVNAIGEAVRSNEVLPWRDVLHEGPTPAGLRLEQMSDVRARFLAECGWGKYKDVRREMGGRDTALLTAPRITLWFEHDLYDQLQLIQILSALTTRHPEVSLICTDQYLGPMNAAQMAQLWKLRQPVSPAQLALGHRAWVAYCSPDRAAIETLLTEDLSALPFLAAALRRHLEDFPSEKNGLSLTDRYILEAVTEGAETFKQIFNAYQKKDEPRFMGDSILERRLQKLTKVRKPLLTPPPIKITEVGRQVLAGELNHVQINGIDRWLGGVHLKS
jgi:hypothetical protein